MRRYVQAIPRWKLQQPSRSDLKFWTPNRWPPLVDNAFNMLHQELAVPTDRALKITTEALGAAAACGRRIGGRSLLGSRREIRARVPTALKRIGNYVARAPAETRRQLDDVVATFSLRDANLETIEELLTAVATMFKVLSDEEQLRTPRDETCVKMAVEARRLQTEYPALNAEDQRRIETALSSSLAEKPAKTSDVFRTMAAALTDPCPPVSLQSHDLVSDYVFEVAQIWLAAGIRPGRAMNCADPSYKSKFHRYADLLLTAVTEPWSSRHDAPLEAEVVNVKATDADLPPQIRPRVSRRCDLDWLVKEDHLKKALKRIQKNSSMRHYR